MGIGSSGSLLRHRRNHVSGAVAERIKFKASLSIPFHLRTDLPWRPLDLGRGLAFRPGLPRLRGSTVVIPSAAGRPGRGHRPGPASW
jgi:hypothetical protein